MKDPVARWRQNPFYVLGLDPTATELESERIGRKLLAELELGLVSARFVETPLGRLERTADLVRSCLGELRDARRRRVHALWASYRGGDGPAHAPREEEPRPAAPWPDAARAAGWKAL